MKNSKLLFISIFILSIVLASSFAVYSFIKETKREKLPVLGSVKDFQLISKDGKPFSKDNLRKKVWVADFFFTTCGDICPVMTKNMSSLNRSFERVPGVHLVSITVNPENDTPEVLTAYAQKQPKINDNWHFLTGKREDIKTLAVESFKLGSIEEPVFHSSYFTLVDRYSNIRGYYDGTDTEEINRLFKDAADLLKER